MDERHSLRWIAVITAEKIDEARKELGLGETANFAMVRQRYRELSKKWHPDICPEKDAIACGDKFRRISNAKALIMRLVRLYRYSLGRETIERDQESYDISFLRIYGDLLTGNDGREANPVVYLSARDRNLITAENVIAAAEILGLSDFASRAQIESAFETRRERVRKGEMSPHNERKVIWAFSLLVKYMEGYVYSFRPDDIRKYQEDAIERHRRQFGNEPMWAGAVFDDPVS